MLERKIRAVYDDETIVVYQAYNRAIAEAAVDLQTFASPNFKMDRMTWIKPSFLWMMYRAGWGVKENQTNILEIQLNRKGFEWALENSCLSHFDASKHASHEAWKAAMQVSPVRLQWDPEKDIQLQNLPYRSIQIGLSGIAVKHFTEDWIVKITDISQECKAIHQEILAGNIERAKAMLPQEEIYPIPKAIALKIDETST